MHAGSVASVGSDSATPWPVALQAPLSTGFSRQEHWSGLPSPPAGDLPDPGIKPVSCTGGGFFTAEPSGVPYNQKEGEKPEGYIGKHFFFFFKFWGRARRVPSQAQPQKQNLGATAGKKKKNTQNPLTGQHPPPARGETWKTLYLKIQDSPDQMRSTPEVPVSLSEARSQQTSRTL